METKQDIRRRIRETIGNTPAQMLDSLSDDVCLKILDRVKSEGKDRMTILLYWSLPDEVKTPQLIDSLHKMGHRILLPVVNGDTLLLREYRNISDMTVGQFEIQEPVGEEFTDYSNIDLAFIPGRAFTSKGDRMGRGKGYYDRLLQNLRCTVIGVCFTFQIVEKIPMDTHDIKMNEVIY